VANSSSESVTLIPVENEPSPEFHRKKDIIGNKREDLSFQRKLESRTKHPFEKLDSCLRRNDKQFISNSRYLGFG
jgi:hypothetical protein